MCVAEWVVRGRRRCFGISCGLRCNSGFWTEFWGDSGDRQADRLEGGRKLWLLLIGVTVKGVENCKLN